MVDKTDHPLTREEFESFKRQTNEMILALHAEHLAVVALMREGAALEKQALAGMKEMFDRFTENLSTIFNASRDANEEKIRIN